MSPRIRHRSRDYLLPCLFFVVPLSGGWFFGREADRRATSEFDHRIEIIAERISSQVRSHVNTQFELLAFAAEEAFVVGSDGKAGSDRDHILLAEFMRRAEAIIERRPGFQAINWISVEGVIEVTTPMQTNGSALNQNLNDHPDPGVRAAFAAAVRPGVGRGGALSRTPVINLYQGGKGFAVFHPVSSGEGVPLGVLNASFRIKDLLEVCLSENALEGVAEFAILTSTGELVFANFQVEDDTSWEHSTSSELSIVGEPLFVRARPTEAWLAAGLNLDGHFILLIGALIGSVLATFSWNMSKRRRGQLESEWRLRLALEGASLGVWDLDVASKTLQLNQEWLRMLGLTEAADGILLSDYWGRIHPDDADSVKVAMDGHLAGETTAYRTEHRVRSSSGNWVWVLDVGSVVEKGSRGEPVRVAGTQHDLTDMRHAEYELERTTARYRAIFEHSPIGLLEQDMSPAKAIMDSLRSEGVTDLRAYFKEHPESVRRFEGLSQTLDINIAFLRMFGASTPEEYRVNLRLMTGDGTYSAYEEELIGLFSGATSCEVDFPLIGLDGTDLLYTVRLTVAPDCLDDLSSVFVSLVDNTRRIQEEEERRQSEVREREAQKSESLAVLAGGVAHDFNNLLVPIIGSIELVMDELPKHSEASRNLLRAEQAAQRAAELSRQMQIYAGRGQVQSESFDVNALVGEMSSLLSSSLPGKVLMESSLHHSALVMEGDPTQLRQLVMNLVLNAADAIGRVPGTVTVRTGVTTVSPNQLEGAFMAPEFRAGECLFLEVRDTGRGLEEATRMRMFEPFFSTKAAGRGLGMSVVLGIVRGHQGALVVESTLGQGTAIRALLTLSPNPIPTATHMEPRMLQETITRESDRTVLLADDEPSVLRFAKAALLTMNVKVIAAENGLEAIELFKKLQASGNGPDLVLLDATMPIVGGLEAMEKIRSLDDQIPIVLSSGYTLEGVAMRAAETETCWFLPKPYGVSELTSMVSLVLSEIGTSTGNSQS